MSSKFPKVLVVKPSAVSLFNVTSHPTWPWWLFTFLKGELWPPEKWPLILTGPNGAERTAGDSRPMETHIHVKADTHVLVRRHWDTRIEWSALLCRPEEWQGNPGTHRQSSAYTGNCWDMQLMSVPMFPCPSSLRKADPAHTHSLLNQMPCFCVLLDKVVAKTALFVWRSRTWFCLPRTTGRLDFVLLLFTGHVCKCAQTLRNMREYCTCILLTYSNWVFWRLNWTQTNLFWPPRTTPSGNNELRSLPFTKSPQ